jgi:predicted Zn-ribbon and HTH transcriptional regulator
VWKHWVSFHRRQIILAGLAFFGMGLAVMGTMLLLAPVSPKGSSAEFHWMHCRECGFEREYSEALAQGKCPLCKPPKVGYFEPTTKKVGIGSGHVNPWRVFNIAVGVEAIIFMAVLLYIFSARKYAKKENYFYCICPRCKWRLRFKEKAAGTPGQCPRCKKVFTFPAEGTTERVDYPVDESEAIGF